MGKVNQLKQDADEAKWQEHFNDYCQNEFGGREPTGREHNDAVEYANQQMKEADDRRS